jgi:hypothetical protein
VRELRVGQAECELDHVVVQHRNAHLEPDRHASAYIARRTMERAGAASKTLRK